MIEIKIWIKKEGKYDKAWFFIGESNGTKQNMGYLYFKGEEWALFRKHLLQDWKANVDWLKTRDLFIQIEEEKENEMEKDISGKV